MRQPPGDWFRGCVATGLPSSGFALNSVRRLPDGFRVPPAASAALFPSFDTVSDSAQPGGYEAVLRLDHLELNNPNIRA